MGSADWKWGLFQEEVSRLSLLQQRFLTSVHIANEIRRGEQHYTDDTFSAVKQIFLGWRQLQAKEVDQVFYVIE